MNLNKTINVCAKLAKAAGYTVFALQKFGLCYSGKDALSTYNKYGTSTECLKGVGRDGANFVYMFKRKYIRCKEYQVPTKGPSIF